MPGERQMLSGELEIKGYYSSGTVERCRAKAQAGIQLFSHQPVMELK
jgi:hypothetical protein